MTELSEIAPKKQHGPKPPSEGPTLCASFSCLLLAGPVSGRTMRVGSPPSKASSTPCHRTGCKKRLETFLYVFRVRPRPSILDCPAKGNPLPKIRVLGSCRKSASRRRIFFFDRPAFSELVTQRTPLIAEHCPENAAPFGPPALPGVDAPSGDGWLAFARPTGFPWGVTRAQRPETTSTYLCSPRTDVPRTS